MEFSNLMTVATCNLNQWALDFPGNLQRVENSCRIAKEQGARYRLGPELEICGYGCEDHFFEMDTVKHCWDSLAKLLEGEATVDLLCDFGMPVVHRSVRYNCRVFCLNRKVILIRPKLFLANEGNYRELRWFTSWDAAKMGRPLESFALPSEISRVTHQTHCPIGFAIVRGNDGATVASEVCEEAFTADSPHVQLSLAGVDVISNGSGSHHELRKLNTRVELIRGASQKCGGAYIYSNLIGCDGGRLYYDGCSMIFVNGVAYAQASQFSMKEVEVVTATIDLDQIRSHRAAVSSRSLQAARDRKELIPIVDVPDFGFCCSAEDKTPILFATPPLEGGIFYHDPMEEIMKGPACWLWDYLRRSGATGFFLPLSGGADSASTAALVGAMCKLVCQEIALGNEVVIADAVRIAGSLEAAAEPKKLCEQVLHTCYMSTKNSSAETRGRAKRLAEELGAYHNDISIDLITTAVLKVFELTFRKVPRFMSRGGSWAEDMALQNIQARTRMVMSYLLAQLLPWVRSKPGYFLVLGSANVDEGLRGYLTKYDCSSADINPIGGISKTDILSFLAWAAKNHFPSLAEVWGAKPTAELRPIEEGAGDSYTQTDEEDMGMSYADLSLYGRLRKIARCGPLSMFKSLAAKWSGAAGLAPTEVAKKVKFFFDKYKMNRHKMTTLTPSYHAEAYV
eukprot:INCI17689.3.p1 GENE.INCI17689.3~~INCI17689.3.p1  ORF type:complete len:681 (-),score=110.69 INCI17689.3:393-2435(-)